MLSKCFGNLMKFEPGFFLFIHPSLYTLKFIIICSSGFPSMGNEYMQSMLPNSDFSDTDDDDMNMSDVEMYNFVIIIFFSNAINHTELQIKNFV